MSDEEILEQHIVSSPPYSSLTDEHKRLIYRAMAHARKEEQPQTAPDWLLVKAEQTTQRYVEAENILMAIAKEPWWKLLFVKNKILRFLASRTKFKF